MNCVNSKLLERICCPVCEGTLRIRGAFLDCLDCGLAFPTLEGVPILIPSRAKKIRKENLSRLG